MFLKKRLFSIQVVSIAGLLIVTSACLSNPGGAKKNIAKNSKAKIGSPMPTEAPIGTGSPESVPPQCRSIETLDNAQNKCKNCYEGLMQTRCPGITDPLDCPDFAVSHELTGLLNQCITQSASPEKICLPNCNSDRESEKPFCNCPAPRPSSTPGPTDPRPHAPVVELHSWPALSETKAPWGRETEANASVSPIIFKIINYGNTDYINNTYGAREMDGTCTNFQTDLPMPAPPVTSVTRPYAEAALQIQTHGKNEFVNSPLAATNFSATEALNWAPQLPIQNGRMPLSEGTHTFAGPITTGTYTRNLGPQDPGQYMLIMELYIFNDWGSQAGVSTDFFNIQANGQKVFNHSFYNPAPTPNTTPRPHMPGITDTYPHWPTVAATAFYSGYTITSPNRPSYCEACEMPQNRHYYSCEQKLQNECRVINPTGYVSVYLIAVNFRHGGGTLSISLGGTGKPWGVNRLEIKQAPFDPRCIKYSFTDSNKLTSTLNVRFQTMTVCAPLFSYTTSNVHPPLTCRALTEQLPNTSN